MRGRPNKAAHPEWALTLDFFYPSGKKKLTVTYPVEDKVQLIGYFATGRIEGVELLTVDELTAQIEVLKRAREAITIAPET
jgi:hypothetical protein